MQTAKLENWALLFLGMDAEGEVFVLVGNVSGHPKLTDGHRIFTSKIPAFRNVPDFPELTNGDVVRTLNTDYTLGAPLKSAVDVNAN